ncbi:MAG: signal peptidase II [Alphaproteobacteria bacterium]|nr:signal peptidase II [Alphaproteobacteria bacterium]
MRASFLGMAIAAAILAADQVTKLAMIEWLADHGRSVEVLGFLNLRLGYNKGISFGLLRDLLGERPWLVIVINAAIVSVLLAWMLRAERRSEVAALGSIVGGALGNVTDRVRQGSVTDFIDLHAYGWHWPSFNLADSAIVVGAFGLVISSLMAGSAPDATGSPDRSNRRNRGNAGSLGSESTKTLEADR